MKIEVKFSTLQALSVVLTPETEGEKRLLGSVLDDNIVGRVIMKYEGHISNNKAELASIILTKDQS